MDIRTYTPDDWPSLQRFIQQHWRAGHPYTDRALFEWQFSGFANTSRTVSRIVDDAGEIAGFLGGIPGPYWAIDRVVPGVVFDLWVVRPDLRDAGLGLLMMRDLEDDFDVTCCLGVNLDVVKYYTARGYSHAPALCRWVVPLQPDGFARLTGHAEPLPDIDLVFSNPLGPLHNPNTLALQLLYEQTVEQAFRLAVHRNAEYWTWRYHRSAGFRYQMFGSVVDAGIVVARIERVIAPDDPACDGMKVLRIIELLPARTETWRGQDDDEHAALIRSVLAWAVDKQCVLADYQCSSNRLDHVLQAAGFIGITSDAPAAVQAVPNLFQPLRRNANPINCVWRLAGDLEPPTPIEPRDIYFVKSDDGMDRPNIWPLPPGSL